MRFSKHNDIRMLIKNGEYAESLKRVQKGLQQTPEDLDLLLLGGEIGIKTNNYPLADNLFGQACSIAPDNTEAIAGALTCAVAESRFQEAEILFNRISASDDLHTVIAKAKYYKSKNNLINELAALEKGFKSYPDSLEIIIMLAESREKNDPDDASVLQLLDYGLSKSKDNEELLERKIKYLYRTENYEECLKLCKTIARNYPNKPIAESARKISQRISHNKSELEKKKIQIHSEPLDKGTPRIIVVNQIDDSEPIQELNNLIGLTEVKNEIYKIRKKLEYEKARSEALGFYAPGDDNYHFVFLGNPGTGKTTVARLMGAIFKEYGIIKDGHLVEASRGDLISQYVGGTAPKTQDVINKSLGGVLFIDEAYSLITGDNDNVGHEALDTLVKNIEDHRNEFVVILAGYPKEMEHLLKENSGLESRFRKIIYFPDYTDDELFLIAQEEAKKKHYTFSPEGKLAFNEVINRKKVGSNFGNARAVRNLMSDAIDEKAKNYNPDRDGKDYFTTLIPKDFGVDILLNPEDKIKKSLEELNSLIGLKNVKNDVETILSIAKYMKDPESYGEYNLANLPINMNMIFTGNPGTGKTTVARIYAKLLADLGLLKKGQFIEASRSDFVGKYQGHTAIKTKELCENAYGGVLFIDEAYSLSNDNSGSDDFGKEAISTLLLEMENNRDKLVVIMAGYTREMTDFISLNSGFASRIGKTIEFPDYTEEELFQIFISFCEQNNVKIDDNAKAELKKLIKTITQNRNQQFGNARDIRNLYDTVWSNMVKRVEKESLKGDDRRLILSEDIAQISV